MNLFSFGRRLPAPSTQFARGTGSRGFLLALLLALGGAPSQVWACACGCGVFEVGTSAMFPAGSGDMAYLEFDYQDQNHNWSDTSGAPATGNPDKEIWTGFTTLGLQTMVNRSWGFQAEVPYITRFFQTTGGATGEDIVSMKWSGIGDIRLEGIYTGFSDDLSAGLTFGLKLPTGSYTHNDAYGDVDRDSEFGTGSTDLLLGAYDRGKFGGNSDWTWYVQGGLDVPVLTQVQYQPGAELDTAFGVYPAGWSVGPGKLTPIFQLKASERTRDQGANAADPVASGFQRVLLVPGLEYNAHPLMVYADVERPVYQHVTGNQLTASLLYKVSVSYHF